MPSAIEQESIDRVFLSEFEAFINSNESISMIELVRLQNGSGGYGRSFQVTGVYKWYKIIDDRKKVILHVINLISLGLHGCSYNRLKRRLVVLKRVVSQVNDVNHIINDINTKMTEAKASALKVLKDYSPLPIELIEVIGCYM